MNGREQNIDKSLDENKRGYEADDEKENAVDSIPMGQLSINEKKKSKPSKTRLILGDGNYSYSRSYLEKRRDNLDFSSAVVVTEYNSEKNLEQIYSSKAEDGTFKNFKENVAALRQMGAEVQFNVDAARIHHFFKGRSFRRIHFNFPYHNDKELSVSENKAKTRQLVGVFFESASKIQKPGDRIHMALAIGADPVWYEDATYGIATFCEQHGYAFINKRSFIDPEKGKRYPTYTHVKTAANQNVQTAETGREFIFEKRIPGKQYGSSSQFGQTRFKKSRLVLKQIETDIESSSGVEHSDAEGLDAQENNAINRPGA